MCNWCAIGAPCDWKNSHIRRNSLRKFSFHSFLFFPLLIMEFAPAVVSSKSSGVKVAKVKAELSKPPKPAMVKVDAIPLPPVFQDTPVDEPPQKRRKISEK